VIVVEVELEGDMVVSDASNSVPNVSKTSWLLDNLYKKHMDTADFSLVCEGQAVPCHRAIMVGASEAFGGMVKPHTKEAQEGRVVLQTTAQVGRAIVEFLYTSRVMDADAKELLRVADMFGLEELKELVEERMVRGLARRNMVEAFQAGDSFTSTRLRTAAKVFLLANRDWLQAEEAWVDRFGDRKDLYLEIHD